MKITKSLLKQLEAQGYEVREKKEWVRKTFVVERSILEQFMKARALSGMKMQDAVTDALAQWAEKK